MNVPLQAASIVRADQAAIGKPLSRGNQQMRVAASASFRSGQSVGRLVPAAPAQITKATRCDVCPYNLDLCNTFGNLYWQSRPTFNC